jgi:Tol biopolymer transport system component
MNCEQVKELLSEYLDNALASEASQQVATHLHTCAGCRETLSDFRRFDILLSQLPRTSPSVQLRQRIFSSPEYLELTGTFSTTRSDRTRMQTRPRQQATRRPQLVALPGGRDPSHSPGERRYLDPRAHRSRHIWGQRIMQVMIAATLLLTIGIGSFIGWNLWQKEQVAHSPQGITPPAGPQTGPLPAGLRFVFLRNGALWSAPTDGGSTIARLTPEQVTVASNWAVRPPQPGHPAGNMIAYIDLQQGRVHTIRSDGQSDTLIAQPLLKSGIAPSSIWDTENGGAILNSLSWSKDGSMLAFVADPTGNGQPGLYIYSVNTGKVRQVPLTAEKGSVSSPAWSPDGVRIAFKVTRNGKTGILDYNIQNNGLLTIVSAVNTPTYPNDTVLTLDWSPNASSPTITWSVGTHSQVHSIWSQRVGADSNSGSQRLANGHFREAVYSSTGNNRQGGWLLVNGQAGQAGDILSLDLSAQSKLLVDGKQGNSVQWSPDGNYICYFDTPTSDLAPLHIVNVTTGNDTLVSAKATTHPSPTWSRNSQHLAYSTGTNILTADVKTSKISQPLKLEGSASALSWSAANPDQLVLALNDGQTGLYLIDTRNDTTLRLDKADTNGPILWTQIP